MAIEGVSAISGLSAIVVTPVSGGDPIGDTLRADAVVYWKFDEASGDRVDATGHGNTAHDFPVPSVTGKIGNAVKFSNSILSRLRCLHNSAVSIADEDFSISFWVKQTTDSQAVIFAKENLHESEYTLTCGAANSQIWFYVAKNDFNDYFEADSNTTDSHGLGAWDFIVACYDSVNHLLKISCNGGAFVTTDTTGFTHAANTDPLDLGGSAAGSGVYQTPELDVDEIGIWKGRVLSDADVALLYNSNAGLAYPFTGQAGLLTNLSAYWSLDEASGTREDSVGSNDFNEHAPIGNTAGKIGNALLLDGILQELIAPSTPYLMVNNTDFYLAGWLKVDTVGKIQIVLSRSDSANNLIYEFTVKANGVLQFLVQSGVPVFASTFGAMSADTWYFVEGYYDNSNLLIGIAINNGSFDTLDVSLVPVTDNGGGLVEIGSLSGNTVQILGGKLEQWLMLKRLPTADERNYLWNGGAGRALFS